MDEQIFQNYLNGLYKSQNDIHRACKGDPFLLGNVMVKIKNHKIQKVNEWRTSILSSGSESDSKTPAEKVDSKESASVRENGEGSGETESKREESSKKQARRRVLRKVRILRHEPKPVEEDIPRYGCLRYLGERCCCLRFLWF